MNADTRLTILIVEDVRTNIDILRDALEERYRLRVAMDANAALKTIRHHKPDMILLDVMLPGMSGFDLCKRLRQSPSTSRIPVIFLTALADEADEALGLQLGAVDYITKPFTPSLVQARVANQMELQRHRHQLEDIIRERTLELEHTQEAVITSMALLAEYRDQETGGHIRRTQGYIKILADALAAAGLYSQQLTPEFRRLLVQSAPLHDIGKVGIPDAILRKEGPLDASEWNLMKEHSVIGASVIRQAEVILGPNSFLGIAREITMSHHERWDGSGYPQGLSGNQIPLAARMMCLADVYDALVSVRPYKKAFTHEQAMKIILSGDERTSPGHFDPLILEMFERIHGRFRRICERVGLDT